MAALADFQRVTCRHATLAVQYVYPLLFWRCGFRRPRSGRLLTLYIGSVLGGGLFALRYHRNTPHYSAVGASGGVVGVLFAAIVLFPQMRLALLFFPVPIPGYIFALVYLGYTLYGMRKQNDQIGHTAHLGGALTGVALVLLWQLL